MKFLVLLVLFCTSVSAYGRLEVTFVPSSTEFTDAANAYTTIWKENNDKIVESMERISKIKFKETSIQAVIFEGVSSAGRDNIPMKLRASYKPATKKATLIHELGHRLLQNIPNTIEVTEHKKLFLMLYDVWVDLYGTEFADKQVLVEKKRKGVYPEAWDWALTLSKSEREAKLTELRSKIP